MNREIKFRAWYTPEKRFVIFALFKGGWCLEEDSVNTGALELWQEFTGLHDRNGKEIYEGDILWNGDWLEDAHTYNDLGNSLVEWKSDCCGFSGMNGESIEVIGNIYENPELLTP